MPDEDELAELDRRTDSEGLWWAWLGVGETGRGGARDGCFDGRDGALSRYISLVHKVDRLRAWRKHTFQRLIPFLDFQHGFIVVPVSGWLQ